MKIKALKKEENKKEKKKFKTIKARCEENARDSSRLHEVMCV